MKLIFSILLFFPVLLFSDIRESVKNGDLEALKSDLSKGESIETTYPNGETLLMQAASKGNLQIVKFLLQNGANPNRKDTRGATAVFYAGASGNKQLEKEIESAIQKKKEEDTKNEEKITAMVFLFAGDVTVNGKQVTRHQNIFEGDMVHVGLKSFLDLKLIGTEANTSIRLKEKTEFRLKSEKRGNSRIVDLQMEGGSALFNVANRNPDKESYTVKTPTYIAGVRGTKFEAEVFDDGSSKISVMEGSVKNRVRIPGIEEVMSKLENSPILKLLEEQSTVLSQGESQAVPVDMVKQLNCNYSNPGSISYSGANGQFRGNDSRKKERLEGESLQKKTREFQEMEKSFSEKDVKIEYQEFQKAKDILVLKNGRRLQGEVKKKFTQYSIRTEYGLLIFPNTEVEGVNFE